MEVPANSIFSSPILYLLSFSMLCFDENLFTCHCQCEKETKRCKGFTFHNCIGHFQLPWQ